MNGFLEKCVREHYARSEAITREQKLQTAVELALMFHSGEPWTDEQRAIWNSKIDSLIGTELRRKAIVDFGATTKTLCDALRKALAV